MNPFSALSWIWKALRGRSVTFAALFALTLAGFSVLAWIKAALQAVGASWLVLLVFPTILLAILARKETDWIPDEEVRRRWARGLIFGSLFAAIATAVLLPAPAGPESPAEKPARRIGPRSK